MPQADNIFERARGRWREILTAHGIDEALLTNEHRPCPVCGGTDRFRFDDKEGAGTFICSGHGPGTGATLLKQFKGYSDWKSTFLAIEEVIGRTPLSGRTSKPDPTEYLRKIQSGFIRPPDPVIRYLRRRRIPVRDCPKALNYHPALEYFHQKRLLGKYPAMVSVVRGPDGKATTFHRTYLGDVPKKKKLVSEAGCGSIWLTKPQEFIGVAEGIETALAIQELFGIPCWALISTSGMKCWQPPDPVRKIVIFGDNDENYAGQAAAMVLAHRLKALGRAVKVRWPEKPGTDYNDVLREKLQR